MKVYCPQCGEEFPNKRDMQRHLLSAPLGHKRSEPEAPSRALAVSVEDEEAARELRFAGAKEGEEVK